MWKLGEVTAPLDCPDRGFKPSPGPVVTRRKFCAETRLSLRCCYLTDEPRCYSIDTRPERRDHAVLLAPLIILHTYIVQKLHASYLDISTVQLPFWFCVRSRRQYQLAGCVVTRGFLQPLPLCVLSGMTKRQWCCKNRELEN